MYVFKKVVGPQPLKVLEPGSSNYLGEPLERKFKATVGIGFHKHQSIFQPWASQQLLDCMFRLYLYLGHQGWDMLLGDGWVTGDGRIHKGRAVTWTILILSAIFILRFLYTHMLALYCRHPEACSCNCIIHYPQLSTPSHCNCILTNAIWQRFSQVSNQVSGIVRSLVLSDSLTWLHVQSLTLGLWNCGCLFSLREDRTWILFHILMRWKFQDTQERESYSKGFTHN